VRFDWAQRYGPIDWPRLHTELLRISAADPAYWKLRTLEEFDGFAWRDRPADPGASDPALDLPYGWRSHPEWIRSFRVSFRSLEAPRWRARARSCGSAGAPARCGRPASRACGAPCGPFEAGDSYAVRAYVPTPTASELGTSSSGRHADELGIDIPISNGGPAWLPQATGGLPVREAQVRFRPFAPYGRADAPSAAYPEVNRSGDGGEALRSSPYAATWRLAQRLRKRARTPYDYVALWPRRLRDGFIYSENPPPARPGQAPLDAFLFDSRSGYCQQYAGAMALLLRMGGVPARVAVGFSPGGYSNRKAAWIVRDTDAHAWVEAWFDRFGWVALDPTPPDTPARSLIASLIPTRGPPGRSRTGALGTEGATRRARRAGRRAACGNARASSRARARRAEAAVAAARHPGARCRRRSPSHWPPSPRGGSRAPAGGAGRTAGAGSIVRSPSSRRRSAAPAVRRLRASRCISSSADCAAHPRPPPTCVPCGPAATARSAPCRRSRRARSAGPPPRPRGGGGPAARVRALWALPPWR
jgi:transglutaminase-like putative cysteine protease